MRYRFMRFPNGKSKALTLSYDDGCENDPRLIETANKYGIKVTLNINSGLINNGGWNLSPEKLRELAESGGHEIAVHGAFHTALGKASAANGIVEVLDGRRGLERIFGKIIRGMAYSDTGITSFSEGVTKEEIKSYLKSLGIVYSRTLGGDNDRFEIPVDFLEWMPTAHHSNPELMNYLDKFLGAEPTYCTDRYPRLFYLWGHSFEFERDNNWEVLERFCEAASGHDDVWYATNIEIYEYVNAYRSLVFNVDNDIVHNPTSTDVWFDSDGETFCVKSGETIRL